MDAMTLMHAHLDRAQNAENTREGMFDAINDLMRSYAAEHMESVFLAVSFGDEEIPTKFSVEIRKSEAV